ncbi:DNA-binding response regulator, NarL/FixJ family, contains REC and HTH domains [Flavobacterium succinicans]|jgi:DNA-binding NarL/FixJ family response regulator|uniref:DNA-binding response regulator, NarL/FixJ family, contains REC and HTH domains n=1 Tax=Flavobacterium succinicans TaxID=29536 RepID=A0A1I4RB77_9FLAO|nr:response regulator [Flavobacterium succinicans]SFM49501.1 DNA-binding response regulator, NarL/FixJ family, contains REC and HTH domains [Flavobacterium succinicans]
MKTPSKETYALITKNILIVDDHPFIIQGYKNAITRYKPEEYGFSIHQAKDCQSGYEVITNPESPTFDIAFLDISMPAYEEKGIFSGEDLAKLLREHMPDCKIILLTMFTEILKIKTIIKTINPNGLVIKNDLTFDELLFAFDKIINNEIYYSQSVLEMLAQMQDESIEIDQFDKTILFQLSKGTKRADISQYLPISSSAIQRRMEEMKVLLELKEGTDEELVKVAKLKGLLL